MIGLRATFDAKPVLNRLARLPERTRKITAQELNRQRRQSRTLIVRGLAQALAVKPQKRLRRRIILPRAGVATPRRLVASALSLVEAMPARYFRQGRRGRGGGFDIRLPAGTSLIQNKPMEGAPWELQTGPVVNIFRRQTKARLPIVKLDVDTSRPGYAVRARALQELAKRWPAQWQGRMRRELKRVFGA